jgi:hypothetical protein
VRASTYVVKRAARNSPGDIYRGAGTAGGRDGEVVTAGIGTGELRRIWSRGCKLGFLALSGDESATRNLANPADRVCNFLQRLVGGKLQNERSGPNSNGNSDRAPLARLTYAGRIDGHCPSPRRDQALSASGSSRDVSAEAQRDPPLYSVTRQARLKAPEPKGGRGNDRAAPWYVPPCGKRRCCRHHLHETLLRRTVKADALRVGIANRANLPSLVCHPPAGGEPRHPHRPGASWPPGREHDDDLYPCQPRPGRGPEPRRPDVSVISLGPEPRYQISKRDIRLRLAGYHGTRSGGSSQGCRKSRIPSTPADRSP